MKTPIKPEDIKAGDLIRWERAEKDAFTTGYSATEFIAEEDGGALLHGSTYYLLDRPAPKVELPTEPTLGWATANFGNRLIVTTGGGRGGTDVADEGYVDSRFITAFTLATAVPTEALDELRRQSKCYSHPDSPTSTFLEAVDKANS